MQGDIMKDKEVSFAAKVWETLSQIDCSKHVKDKGEFTYLSWTWAWGILMENYPESTFARLPITLYDGTAETVVTVDVREGDKWLTRTMWLPVMDFRNCAIPNPDSRQISDTYMRCLVKCIALHGLGHYIYAGEDIPREEDAKPVHRFKTGEKETIVSNTMAALEADSIEMLDKALGEGYDDLDPAVKIKIGFLFDSTTRASIKKLREEYAVKKRDIEEDAATEELDLKLLAENRNGS